MADFMDNMRELFDECDIDKNGSLSSDEFHDLCAKIGLNRDAAEETFKRLDSDGDGRITFDEFSAGFQRYTSRLMSSSTSSSQVAPVEPASAPLSIPSTKAPAGQTSGNGSPSGSRSPGRLTPSPTLARPRPAGGALPASNRRQQRMLNIGGGTDTTTTTTSSSTGTGSSSHHLLGSSSSGPGYEGGSSEFTSVEGGIAAGSNSDINYNQTPYNHQPDTNGNKIFSISGGGEARSPNDDDFVVYSSEALGEPSSANCSGQFGSLASNASYGQQLRTMQDLLDCVQKLQSENQILTQIFFKDKREREQLISQLGEEFDQQVREVEERANRRAREELEAEKRRLREMMHQERETLQHHYETIEKMSKLIKSNNSAVAKLSSAGSSGGEVDSDVLGISKARSNWEDAYMENKQLKQALSDTKSDVALIWREMERLKRQYEDKLSNAYERNNETKTECEHIRQQLDLMKDSNRKLQDASDVLTHYIADKVEPVIKSAGDPSLTANLNLLANGSPADTNRRVSILSDYLIRANNNNEDDDGDDEANHNGKAAEGARRLPTNRTKSDGPTSSELQLTEHVDSNTISVVGNLIPAVKSGSRHSTTNPFLSNEENHPLSGFRKPALASMNPGNRNKEQKSVNWAGLRHGSFSSDPMLTATGQPRVEPADGPSTATFNIILVGDSFVGKSSFAARFIEGNFVQGLISNCSIDFKTKAYKVDGTNYTVNLWDTAGQERFRSITASYFRKADGIILMYDVTERRTYLNVRNWMGTIADTASENVAVLLICNKIDLRNKMNADQFVPFEEGLRLAREYDIEFIETSVKTGTNLVPAMGRLIRLIAQSNMPGETDDDRIKLSDKSKSFNCMPKSC